MKARQSRSPFIILFGISAFGVVIGLLTFYRTGDFSLYGFAKFIGLFLVLAFIGLFLAFNFMKAQSIELTSEGIWSLVWLRAEKGTFWPRFEKTLLRWADMSDWSVRGHLVYLRGPQNRLIINTVLFKEPRQLIELINNSTCLNK